MINESFVFALLVIVGMPIAMAGVAALQIFRSWLRGSTIIRVERRA